MLVKLSAHRFVCSQLQHMSVRCTATCGLSLRQPTKPPGAVLFCPYGSSMYAARWTSSKRRVKHCCCRCAEPHASGKSPPEEDKADSVPQLCRVDGGAGVLASRATLRSQLRQHCRGAAGNDTRSEEYECCIMMIVPSGWCGMIVPSGWCGVPALWPARRPQLFQHRRCAAPKP